MQNSARQHYAQYPQGKDIEGPVQDFADGLGLKQSGDYVPTIVNPIEGKNCTFKTTGLAWIHMIVWLVAIAMNAAVGARVGDLMPNATNGSGWVDPNNMYGEGATETSKFIGMVGWILGLVGVGLIVAAAAAIPSKEYNNMPILNLAIQVLTSYSTVSAFYVFCLIAEDVEGEGFILALIGVLASAWAQVTLYATSAAIDVKMMARAFVPAMAVSVQFVSALSISGDQFKCVTKTGDAWKDCNGTQKFLAWLVPACTAIGVVLMFGIRKLLAMWNKDKAGPANKTNAQNTSAELQQRPFMRSLILLFYFTGGILSIYKVSIMAVGWNPVAYMFALLGMLFNFAIIAVVFVPGAEEFTTGTD